MQFLRVDTLAIGDELLVGRISDTNSTYVAAEFFKIGVRLRRTTVIEDRIDVILATLKDLSEQTDVVISFGGLGPTSDDLTAEAVAKLLNCEIIESPAARARIEELCRIRKRELTPQLLKQAKYPEAATPILNNKGLAVGFLAVIGKCRCFFFPGVPDEMKSMFPSALRYVEERSAEGGDVLRFKRWKCLGVAESELQRHMDPIEKALPKNMWLGYQTKFPENHLTLYCRCAPEQAIDEALGEWPKRIRGIVDKWAYTEDDKELEHLVIEALRAKSQKLVLVESCTGGTAARRLTDVPGSSDVFWGSFVSYQIDAKAKMLGVKLEKPEQGVAREVTRWLAQSALQKSGCDYVAAVTGYMGPTGGTATDPIGTVYLCAGDKDLEETKIQLVDMGRTKNQWAATTHLLAVLYRRIKQK